MATDKDIFALVNEKLDPRALLALIGWNAEKVRDVGPSLHSPCPLHKGQYSTLLIDKERKTFVCTHRDCRGRRGGALVDLWAMAGKMEPVRAALDLCERFKFEIEGSARSGLSLRLFEGAETAYVKRNLEESEELAAKALQLDPQNVDALLLMAKIRYDRGDALEATKAYFVLAQAFQRRGEADRAAGAYKRVLEYDAGNVEAKAGLAGVLVAQGETHQALRAYQEICAANESSQRRQDNGVWLERMLELAPDLAEERRRLADLRLEAGRLDEGVAQLRLLAQRLRAHGGAREAVETLARVAQLLPGDVEAREDLAAATLESGDVVAARDLYRDLAEDYRAKGMADEAEACLDSLVDIDPDNLEARQRMAQLLESRGRRDEALAAYRQLALKAGAMGDRESAIGALERLRELDGGNLQQREELAELYLKADRVAQSLEEFHCLAEGHFNEGHRDEGIRISKQTSMLARGLLDHRLQVANRYERYGLKEQAVAEYLVVGADAAQAGDHETARQASEAGLKLAPDSLAFMETRYRALRRLESPPAILARAKPLIERYLEDGLLSKAEESIKECLELAPEDRQLRQWLFDLYCKEERYEDLEQELEVFAGGAGARGDADQIIGFYRQFLDLVPDNARARERMTALYRLSGDTSGFAASLREEAARLISLGDPARARGPLEQILLINPDDGEALAQLAAVIHQSESFKAAAPHYLEALDKRRQSLSDEEIRGEFARLQGHDPDNADVRRAYADYLEGIHEWAAAREEYLKLAEVIRETTGAPNDAIPVLEHVCARDPNDGASRARLAELWREADEPDKAAAIYRGLGARLAESGDEARAIEAYSSVLKIAPDDSIAHESLAGLYARRGETGLAIRHCEFLAGRAETAQGAADGGAAPWLERIVELDPARLDALAKCAEAYDRSGDVAKARARYERLGAALADSGAVAEAVKAYQRLTALAPDDLGAGARLAELLEASQRLEEAKAEYLRLADRCLAKEDHAQAQSFLQRRERLDPGDPSTIERLARLHEQMGAMDAAVAEYEQVCELFSRKKQSARAIAILERLRKTQPQRAGLQERLVALLESEGQIDKAVAECLEACRAACERGEQKAAGKWVARLSRMAPDAVSPRLQAAALLLGAGLADVAAREVKGLIQYLEKASRWEDALEACEEGARLLPGDEGIESRRVAILRRMGRDEEVLADSVKIAGQLRQQGAREAAEARYREALELAPRNVECLDALAALCIESGRTDEASGYLLRLSAIHEERLDFAQAIAARRQAIGNDPRNAEALVKLADLCGRAGRAAERAPLLLDAARAYAGQGEGENARRLVEQALAEAPEDRPALRALAEVYVTLGETAQACSLLMNLSRLCQAAGSPQEMESALRRVVEISPENIEAREQLAAALMDANRPSEAAAAYLALCDLLQRKREYPAAIAVADRLIALQPGDPAAQDRLLALLEKGGQTERAVGECLALCRRALEGGDKAAAAGWAGRVSRIAPNDVPGRVAVARIFKEGGCLAQARGEIAALLRHFEDTQRWDDLLGACRQGEDLLPEDLQILSCRVTALRHLDREEEARAESKRMARMLKERGDKETAVAVYRDALALAPEDVECLEALADLYTDMGRADEAARGLRRLSKACERGGDTAKAIEAMRRAIGADPDDLEGRLLLAALYGQAARAGEEMEEYLSVARVYMERGDLDGSRRVLERLRGEHPHDRKVQGDLAETYLGMGELSLACDIFASLSKNCGAEGDLAQAVEFARRVAQIDPENPGAREELARLLVEQGEKEQAAAQWAEIAELYERRNASAGAAAPRAGAAALRPVSLFWMRALELAPARDDLRIRRAAALEREGARNEAASEFLVMARERLGRGDAGAAVEHGQKALAICEGGSFPEALADAHALLLDAYQAANETERVIGEILWLVPATMAKGRMVEADGLLSRGLALAPDNAQLHVWRGEALARLKRKGQAMQALQRGLALYQAGGEEERQVEVMKKILDLDPQNPEMLNGLVESLFRLGRTEEAVARAFDLADSYVQRGYLDQAEQEYRRIVARAPDTVSAWQFLIQTHLQIGPEEDLVPDYMALAEIYVKAGKVNDAVRTLRRVIEIDPENLVTRRRYVDLYLQIGLEGDLIDDYLRLALTYEKLGNDASAREWYERVAALDPANQAASEFLRRIASGGAGTRGSRMGAATGAGAATGVGAAGKGGKDLSTAIANYLNILKINGQNTAVRLQLAAVYDQMGKEGEAIEQWGKASETLLQHGELEQGIEILEQLLARRPNDASIRERLSRAALKRDAFSAIESALRPGAPALRPGAPALRPGAPALHPGAQAGQAPKPGLGRDATE